MEDGILNGGLYTAVLETVNKSNLENIKIIPVGYDDTFITHGSTAELEEKMRTDAKSIAQTIEEKLECYCD